MEMTDSKKTMIWSLCAALCVALPQIVRIIPGADMVYRAMYLPVLLCGAVCGPWGGVLCAFTGTCVAAVISGSPTVVLFPVVLTELIVMGFASGVLMRRKSGPVRGILLAVFLGMIAGGFVAAALFSPGRGSMVLWVWAYVMLGIPAIVVQLVLMPTIFKALDYSGLVTFCDAGERKTSSENLENTLLPAEKPEDISPEVPENAETSAHIPPSELTDK